jgi:hypothetical protein
MSTLDGSRPDRGVARDLAVALVATVLTLGAAGCVPMNSGSGANTPEPAASEAPTPRSSSAAASVPPRASGTSAGPTGGATSAQSAEPASALRTSQSVISGRSGTVSWRVRVPRFSGAPVATEINKRIRAAVQDQIDRAKREGRSDDGDQRRLEGEGTVVTNDGRTAQVTVTYSDYLDGTAHPTNYVSTTVVDVTRAQPIRLTQVFRNPTGAYRKLKPEILKAAGEESATIDQAGLAPKQANWANWQTNDAGMLFVFGDYQLGGHGLRQYVVPWPAVEPLLTDYAKRVLAPQ